MSGKVDRIHLERTAFVYVRQSTMKQVQNHRESQYNQYALVQRALTLGWAPHQVQVIDSDLGQSGQDSQGRLGFQELVAEVSWGEPGSSWDRRPPGWPGMVGTGTICWRSAPCGAPSSGTPTGCTTPGSTTTGCCWV